MNKMSKNHQKSPFSKYFAKKMREKAKEKFLGRILSKEEALAEKGIKHQKRNPDVNLLGLKLMPPTQLDIEALQNGMIPPKLAHLAKKMSLPQIQRLMKLLWEYYTQGMSARSAEWKELEHMLNTASKGAVTAKKGLRRTGNIISINKSHPIFFRKTG
ncbi:MAG: hypothetical protein COT90_01835 [Candidatus Diapherotrites archaeon CG10_big_fil_rev_8_21_14_0_10_31_34]|nr:MAG: hypothetical protein COT90_01835 [Candidatus Diapherotrites archaeon CG10_big_fil_rev_8_21_14_0_10_31_34]PJA18145.1 MAG: hypothetical protein COX63_02390 [Candidatus Diapherotrites archaeon CG_4_10_14_0_2_um_filter_31_5]